jgi:hypothetical protein
MRVLSYRESLTFMVIKVQEQIDKFENYTEILFPKIKNRQRRISNGFFIWYEDFYSQSDLKSANTSISTSGHKTLTPSFPV